MKYLVSILVLIVISLNLVHSQENQNRILPKLLGASNAGKEFYLTFHPCWEENNDVSDGIYIYISSQFKTKVTLEIPWLGISKSKETIPNQIIEFKLTTDEALAYKTIWSIQPKPAQIWVGKSIKITAGDPIICYGVVKMQNTSDGFLAIPVHNWSKNYQVASSEDVKGEAGFYYPSYTSIVAAYDNTEVVFKLGGNPKTGVPLENGDTLKLGKSKKRILNSGDIWLIPGIGKNNDLSGSQITSDKIVGVFSGNYGTSIPKEFNSADYIIEQEIPSDYWGKKYFVPTIMNRLNSPIVKIFAKEPNSLILMNNILLSTITDLDGTPGIGFITTRTNKDPKSTPVIISSSNPINVVLYNTSFNDDQINSDPFQMNIISEDQFQKEVTFNTPGTVYDTVQTLNCLSVIFKSLTKSIPDDLMIGEYNNDSLKWTKFSTYFKNYKLDSIVGEKPDSDGYYHYFFSDTLFNNGLYKIKANKPFGAYCYSLNGLYAYGFPLASGMIDQTSSDNLAPELSIDSVENGNYTGHIVERGVPEGKSNKKTDELQSEDHIAGFSFVEMINGLSYNYKFERDDFMPGDSKTLNYKLTKINSKKDAKAVIYISDRRGNDTTVELQFIEPPHSMIPVITSEITDFGLLSNKMKKQLVFKLINPGQIDSKPIESIKFETINSGFKILSDITYPLILKVNEEIEFTVEFTADTLDGIIQNRIGISTSDTTIYYLNLQATVANSVIGVSDIDFGTYILGKTALKDEIEITNTGNWILEIEDIEFPSNNAFTIQAQKPSKDNPLKIGAKSIIKINVRFEPTEEGIFSDSVKFYSDGKVIKNISYLNGNAIISSVAEFENKYGVINIAVNENEIKFTASNNMELNSYKIYDLKGKIIQTGSPVTILNNFNIKLPNLTASVYFIELNTKYGKIVKKFILE